MELLFNSRDGKEKFPGKREVDFSPKSRDPGTATLVPTIMICVHYDHGLCIFLQSRSVYFLTFKLYYVDTICDVNC